MSLEVSICTRLDHDFWEYPDHKTAPNKTPTQQTLKSYKMYTVNLDQVGSVRLNQLLFQSAYLMSKGCLFRLLYLEITYYSLLKGYPP